jgi:hypothetical protein
MPSMLNAGGAKLWQSANAISSSILAGQFTEIFWGDADLMKSEKGFRCALYKLNIPHRHKIPGFSLSQ